MRHFGGLGTRLGTLTSAINKSLLPLDDLPIISHLLRFAQQVSESVLITTTLGQVDNFARVAVNDPSVKEHNVYYNIQEKPIGIADALKYAKKFCDGGPVLVLLGDNLHSPSDYANILNVCKDVDEQSKTISNKLMSVLINTKLFGSHIWVTSREDANNYGVLEIDETGMPCRIVEKPIKPLSKLVITGIYLFDSRVWSILDALNPSGRGEYEITDVLNHYLSIGDLNVNYLEGDWYDIGQSIDSYWDIIHRRKNLHE